jgi:hypothetical protein
MADSVPEYWYVKRSIPVDFFGAFISGILSIVVYIVVFMGVYKLYYIAKDIHEIKELMERKLRTPAEVPSLSRAIAPVAAAEVTRSLSDEDAASAYAEQLLRAVGTESPSRVSETQEVR